MTRLLLPRTLAAIVKPDPESDAVAAAVIALDTAEDAYLVIDRTGESWWSPMSEVRFADDIITAAINRADETLRAMQRGTVAA